MSRELYEPYAREQARANGVPEQLFVCQITQESGWNPNAVSPAGAIGIAQIVPRFHPNVNPWDPLASLRYAAELMASHYRTFGRWDLALAAYNAGGGAVMQYGGIPPFPETQRYVSIIMSCAGEPAPTPAPPGPSPSTTETDAAAVAAVALLLLLVAGV